MSCLSAIFFELKSLGSIHRENLAKLVRSCQKSVRHLSDYDNACQRIAPTLTRALRKKAKQVSDKLVADEAKGIAGPGCVKESLGAIEGPQMRQESQAVLNPINELPVQDKPLYEKLNQLAIGMLSGSDCLKSANDFRAVGQEAALSHDVVAEIMALSGAADAYLLLFLREKKYKGIEAFDLTITYLTHAISLQNSAMVKTQQLYAVALHTDKAQELFVGLSMSLVRLQDELNKLNAYIKKKLDQHAIIKRQGIDEGWWFKNKQKRAGQSKKSLLAKYLANTLIPKVEQLSHCIKKLSTFDQATFSPSANHFLKEQHCNTGRLEYFSYKPNVDIELVNLIRDTLKSIFSSPSTCYYFSGGVVGDYFLTNSNRPVNINMLVVGNKLEFTYELLLESLGTIKDFYFIQYVSQGARDIIKFTIKDTIFSL
jgi:hypothetical protein